ncbi:MAG TPA: HAMP domain-containing sensor histidine kinase [Thermoanaerobaculia bacterium]|jgi:signal transduction histidine kinase
MPASLRSRLALAAVFLTVGFSAFVAIVWTVAPLIYPGWPYVVHGSVRAHPHLWIVGTVLFTVSGYILVRRALASLDRLRARLAEVHAGRERALSGSYPTEVQPLVDDLNALLEQREQTVRRALAKAGDLAHGLKTPLAVMSQEAERADTEAGGAADGLAATVLEQVERMRRQIESHLAQARAAATGARPGARCLVRESVDGLVRTLSRLHAGKGLTIRVDVAPGCAVRGGREELDEMLGNLLDNACQWARTLVAVAAADEESRVVVTVDDDGPGLPPAMWDTVLQRGIRADEAAPGSGLGLAIVRDLAELAGGSIRLSHSPLGGLRATLELPAA